MLIASNRHTAATKQAREMLSGRMALAWTETRQPVPAALAQRATDAAHDRDVDILITIGGGSTIELGKAAAVSTGLPLLAVPTTYSGSEMTPI